MYRRVNEPEKRVKKDGTPVTVLAESTVLSRGYRLSYLRTEGNLNVYKAIKDGNLFIIKEAESRDRESVNLLTHEQFVLEQFSHSGIQQCIELFREAGWHYLVLEYVGGTSLDRVISPNPAIFMGERLLFEWANQLYSLFSYLHLEKNNGIYGDTLVNKVIRSPRNIVRDREGQIHLVDIVGASPCLDDEENGPAAEASLQPLAAPEFYEGKETDERSDVFTLGAIFYYLLSNGRGRDRKTGLYPSLRSINGSISPKLEELIMKALQNNPDDRFQTIKAMKSAHSLLKFDTKPGNMPEDVGKKAFSAKTAAAALCTIMAVILFLLFLCAHKPVDKKAAKADPVMVAVTQGPGSASQGLVAPPQTSTVDPMLYPQYRQASPSIPPMTAKVSSVIPSEPHQAAASPSLTEAAPTPSQQRSLLPTLTSTHYPTGAPQTAIHIAEQSPEPAKQAAVNAENLSKEERLAKILRVNAGDLEPARDVFISPENDYSISIPIGYYFVKKKGRSDALFIACDEKNLDSSLRTIHISSTFVPNSKIEEVIAAFRMSLVNSGAGIIEEKFINTRGRFGMVYEGYSFKYSFGPPPGVRIENINFTHQDVYFAHKDSGRAYRVKFCAPADNFNTYESSEYSNTLRTLHFSISSD